MQITVVPLIIGILFFAVGALFAGFAAISLRRRRDLLKNGVSTSGVVIGLDESDGCYAPIIHFTTYAGESRQHIPALHTCTGYLDHPFKNKHVQTEKDRHSLLANAGGSV